MFILLQILLCQNLEVYEQNMRKNKNFAQLIRTDIFQIRRNVSKLRFTVEPKKTLERSNAK